MATSFGDSEIVDHTPLFTHSKHPGSLRDRGGNNAPESVSPPPAYQAGEPSAAAHITSLVAENVELRARIEQIRAERNRLAEIQSRIMELLNVQSPDKLVHDVRNVLNERELLKALVGDM